jgi:hypothetical protein
MVKILKFLSGQEVIAKVASETETAFVLQSPLTVQPMRSPDQTQLSLGLMPFSWAGLSDSVNIPKSHVLCAMDPEPDLETQYLAGLAGIAMPKSQPITLAE